RSIAAHRRGEEDRCCARSGGQQRRARFTRHASPRRASCLAGWLGGLDPIPDFNPLLPMASGVYLTFFASFAFGTPGFPLSDVPLHRMAADARAGRIDVKPARIFGFDEIREAHRLMEANQAGGKMVVVHH